MKYKVCENCNIEFPNWIVIDDKRWDLRRRKYCIDCSPLGQHNTRKLTDGDFGTKLIDGIKHKRCRECNDVKPFGDFYSKSEWGRYYTVCKTCNCSISQKRRDEFKRWSVEYKGGQCKYCGYNKCLASLDFHHTDPSKKEYIISSQWKKPKEIVKQELDKCDLVCKNCHGEIHAGLR